MTPTIVTRVAFLVVETNKNHKDIKYHIRIVMKDSNDNEYCFNSAKIYDYDESGKARFDLDVLGQLNR